MSTELVFEKRDSEKIKKATICLMVKEGGSGKEVLLAMKKRGFGAGFYNGPGGKPNLGESLELAAIREVKEEICVDIHPEDLVSRGVLHFYFPESKKDWDQDVYVFVVTDWTGIPSESEEMKPEWFSELNFPYDHMWPDDPYWMPVVLSGKKIEAWFVFGEDEKILQRKIVQLP